MTPEGKALIEAISKGQLRLARLLIDGGTDVNCKNWSMQTPLMVACINNKDFKWTKSREKMIKLMLKQDADPNCVDSDGNTAIILACKYFAAAEVITTLLENNSNPQLINQNGDTALTQAMKIGNIEAVRALITYYDCNKLHLTKTEQFLLQSKYHCTNLRMLIDKLKHLSLPPRGAIDIHQSVLSQSHDPLTTYESTTDETNYSSERPPTNTFLNQNEYIFQMDNELSGSSDCVFLPPKEIRNLCSTSVMSSGSCASDSTDRSDNLPRLLGRERLMTFSHTTNSPHKDTIGADTFNYRIRRSTFTGTQLRYSLPSQPSFVPERELPQNPPNSMNEANLLEYRNETSKLISNLPHPLGVLPRRGRRDTLPPLLPRSASVDQRLCDIHASKDFAQCKSSVFNDGQPHRKRISSTTVLDDYDTSVVTLPSSK